MQTLTQTNLRLIASARTWIEAEAVRQLCAAAKLDGVRLAVGLPDLQPGPLSPTGAAFIIEGVIHPRLIGSDIGCGMALFKTDLPRRSAECADEWARVRFDLEHPWEDDARARLVREELCATQFAGSFGTLGGGQHFVELQAVEKVFQPAALRRLGLAKEHLTLLVHAGSGDFGRSAFETHIEDHGIAGADPVSGSGTRYRLLHDHALRWAKTNRAVLAERFLSALSATGRRVLDACHNSITQIAASAASQSTRSKNTAAGVRSPSGARRASSPLNGERAEVRGENDNTSLWLHRCGAAPADCGPLVIPGSRGTFSYLVQPVSAGRAHAWSLARGAGRRWSRSEARVRMRERFEPEQLTQTGLGGRVICEDLHLLYEEAPPAYKDVETVIADLVDAGLIEVIATLRPLLTYKTRAVRR